MATTSKLDAEMMVVPSTTEPGRMSLRTVDGRSARTALERGGFKVGDRVVLMFAMHGCPLHGDEVMETCGDAADTSVTIPECERAAECRSVLNRFGSPKAS